MRANYYDKVKFIVYLMGLKQAAIYMCGCLGGYNNSQYETKEKQ